MSWGSFQSAGVSSHRRSRPLALLAPPAVLVKKTTHPGDGLTAGKTTHGGRVGRGGWRLEWHVRTCYDCCLWRGRVNYGWPSLSCRDDAGSAALLLLHMRGSCVLAPRLHLATQMSFLTWEVSKSVSGGLLPGPFHSQGVLWGARSSLWTWQKGRWNLPERYSSINIYSVTPEHQSGWLISSDWTKG